MSNATQPTDPQQTLADLSRRLQAVPRDQRPREHAALQYTLGLAYAELPTGNRVQNLSLALQCYEVAIELFARERFPVEHARTQNAKGATLRELGRPAEAAQAHEVAAELFNRDPVTAELGAALNNLGLARTELGEFEAASTALERAVEVFAATERAQRPVALLNLGQARAAAGEQAEAISTYEEAIADVNIEEQPYHWAMIQHSLGVSLTAVEEPERAAGAFAQSLRVFTPSRYPFQHALAKNNYGLAWAQRGGPLALRRALAAYEDTLRLLDPRIHRPQWEQAYRNLELAEAALDDLGESRSRPEHFILLAAEVDDAEREMLLRERLTALFDLPERTTHDALVELDFATVNLPEEASQRVTGTWLDVLMELPNPNFVAAVKARLAAHEHLEPDARQQANEVLDSVIQNHLMSPQRIRVRDTLEMLGWERP